MSPESFWLSLIGFLAVTAGIIIGAGFMSLAVSRKKTKQGNPSTLFGPRQIQDWDRQFSWRPVRTSDGIVWLQYYWVRKVYLPVATDGHRWSANFTYQKVKKIDWYLW